MVKVVAYRLLGHLFGRLVIGFSADLGQSGVDMVTNVHSGRIYRDGHNPLVTLARSIKEGSVIGYSYHREEP